MKIFVGDKNMKYTTVVLSPELSMEKTSLSYSTKNIPVPDNNTFKQLLIRKAEKFVHGLR